MKKKHYKLKSYISLNFEHDDSTTFQEATFFIYLKEP